MSYIITSNGYGIGYYVARSYIGNCETKDFISPILMVDGKRLVVSRPLVFETVEKARHYLKSHEGLIPDTWKIVKYNSRMNTLEREVFNIKC